MKRVTKIVLIVLGAIFAVLTAAIVGTDLWVSGFVQKQVNKSLADLPGCEAQCGTIHLRFFSGTASVENLRFYYRGEVVEKKDTLRPGIEVTVDRVDVGRLFYTMLMKKQILISDVHITRPSLSLWLDEKHPENCFPQIEDKGLEKADMWFARADLMRLHVKNASLRLKSVRTKLDVAADSLSVTLNDLAYDSVFHYNDSVYRLSLGSVSVLLPDGRMRLETSNLEHRDQGALKIGATRIANTMRKNKLGDMVKEPVTWIDMQVESVETSPLNPIRKAMAQDFTLDKIKAVVSRMHVYRDSRYKPTRPFPMPQEILTALPVTFRINQVDAQIKHIYIELATTETNCGDLTLQGIKAVVKNVTNKKNETMVVDGICPVMAGQAKAHMSMTMNKACDFSLDMQAANIDAAFMNPFIRPLIGITFAMQMDGLDTHYAGNSEHALGSFKLLYHGLNIQVHKEDDIPYKIVTKHANTFTQLANTLLTRSNPSSVDVAPRAYQVEWKRDPMMPVAFYLFGPCIDGVKKTLLPGLYVHMQTKEKRRK